MANDNTYITLNEAADRLHLSVRVCREFLIGGRRVNHMKVGRQYLIVRKSFEDWERSACTKSIKHW